MGKVPSSVLQVVVELRRPRTDRIRKTRGHWLSGRLLVSWCPEELNSMILCKVPPLSYLVPWYQVSTDDSRRRRSRPTSSARNTSNSSRSAILSAASPESSIHERGDFGIDGKRGSARTSRTTCHALEERHLRTVWSPSTIQSGPHETTYVRQRASTNKQPRVDIVSMKRAAMGWRSGSHSSFARSPWGKSCGTPWRTVQSIMMRRCVRRRCFTEPSTLSWKSIRH